jgi:hypothetical protein
MAAIQVAPTPPPVESVSADAAQATPQQLSIGQTLRIMDVATLLRKEQALAQQQLNIEETKAMLRERLLSAAKVTGEPLTSEQVDIAIEHYYDKLHVFEAPKWSLELASAHVYVMRGTIIKWALALGAAAGALAWLW